MTFVCGLISEVNAAVPTASRRSVDFHNASYFCTIIFFTGAPVDVGMSIDIASIDMVSEVNMVSFLCRLLPRDIYLALFKIRISNRDIYY